MTETQLTDAFLAGISDGHSLEPPCVLHDIVREMDCQKGRPDLVASWCRVDDLSIDSSILALALSKRSLAYVLSLLSTTATRTRESMIACANLSGSTLDRALRELEEYGFVLAQGRHRYLLSPQIAGIDWYLSAFEVKLNNWKRALSQALSYQAFAQYATVVVAEPWSRRAERQANIFRKFKVGLVVVDSMEGTMRNVVSPGRIEPRSRFHHYYAVGSFLSCIEGGSSFKPQ